MSNGGKEVSDILQSKAVKSALLGAIGQNLNLDNLSDVKKIQQGFLHTLSTLEARNQTIKTD